MTDRYAVIGNPIAQSKSPLIHTAFSELAGQDLVYDKIEAPGDGFAAAWWRGVRPDTQAMIRQLAVPLV